MNSSDQDSASKAKALHRKLDILNRLETPLLSWPRRLALCLLAGIAGVDVLRIFSLDMPQLPYLVLDVMAIGFSISVLIMLDHLYEKVNTMVELLKSE